MATGVGARVMAQSTGMALCAGLLTRRAAHSGYSAGLRDVAVADSALGWLATQTGGGQSAGLPSCAGSMAPGGRFLRKVNPPVAGTPACVPGCELAGVAKLVDCAGQSFREGDVTCRCASVVSVCTAAGFHF